MPGIRPATPQDVEAVARLFRAVRTACLPYLPDLHSPAEELWFFRERVFPECTVWVAGEAAIDGFCAWRPGWVDHLYIRPECHGQGLGTALLARGDGGLFAAAACGLSSATPRPCASTPRAGSA